MRDLSPLYLSKMVRYNFFLQSFVNLHFQYHKPNRTCNSKILPARFQFYKPQTSGLCYRSKIGWGEGVDKGYPSPLPPPYLPLSPSFPPPAPSSLLTPLFCPLPPFPPPPFHMSIPSKMMPEIVRLTGETDRRTEMDKTYGWG